MLLAIETSQRSGAVAIETGSGVAAEPLRVVRRHDEDLIPAIDRAVRGANGTPRDLTAIIVSIGPGGFTGLRVGISTAKALAMPLGIPIVAVPTALVVAEALTDRSRCLIALASKGEQFWGTYVSFDGDAPYITDEPGPLAGASAALDDITQLVADEHVPASLLDRARSSGIPVAEPSFDATALLRVGVRELDAGRTTPPEALKPLYAREPEAVRLADLRAAGKSPVQ